MSGTWSTADVLGPDLAREDDARPWPARAREFARDVVGPIGEALDAMDPREVHRARLARSTTSSPRPSARASRGSARHAHLGGIPVSPARRAARARGARDRRRGASRRCVAVAPAPFRWAAACGAPSLVADLALPYLSAARTDWIGCCALDGGCAAVRASRACRRLGAVGRDRPRARGRRRDARARGLSRRRPDGGRAGGRAARRRRRPARAGPGRGGAAGAVPRADRARPRPHARTTTVVAGVARRVAAPTRGPPAPCWRSASGARPTRGRCGGPARPCGRGASPSGGGALLPQLHRMYRLLDGDARARARDLPAGRRPPRRRRRRLRPARPRRPGDRGRRRVRGRGDGGAAVRPRRRRRAACRSSTARPSIPTSCSATRGQHTTTRRRCPHGPRQDA